MPTLIDKVAPVLDDPQYPRRWNRYIGQEPAVQMLQVAAASARIRKEALDHVLISHPSPGIGKTALAVLIANELRTTVRVVSGPVSNNGARMLFSEMQDRDVLLYDEFHQVMDGGKRHAEWLLSYLQDGMLMGPRGPELQSRVTIVAATTDAGRLPQTIVDRFPLQPPMEDYNTHDAAKIAKVQSQVILLDLPKLTTREATIIAGACHNNPRVMRRMLISLRDWTITKRLPLVNGHYDVTRLLASTGITVDGLDVMAQRYLKALAVEFDGSAGAKNLEDRLQQPGGLSQVERVLMDKGLLTKTPTGRMLTQAGIARFHALSA